MWLGDLWTGRLTVRQASVLASMIPAGHPVWAGTDDAWTAGEHLTASIIDELRISNYMASTGKTTLEFVVRPAEAAQRAHADRARRVRHAQWEADVTRKVAGLLAKQAAAQDN